MRTAANTHKEFCRFAAAAGVKYINKMNCDQNKKNEKDGGNR